MDFSSSGWSSRLHLIYPAVLWCCGWRAPGPWACNLCSTTELPHIPPAHSSLTGLRPKGTQSGLCSPRFEQLEDVPLFLSEGALGHPLRQRYPLQLVAVTSTPAISCRLQIIY